MHIRRLIGVNHIQEAPFQSSRGSCANTSDTPATTRILYYDLVPSKRNQRKLTRKVSDSQRVDFNKIMRHHAHEQLLVIIHQSKATHKNLSFRVNHTASCTGSSQERITKRFLHQEVMKFKTASGERAKQSRGVVFGPGHHQVRSHQPILHVHSKCPKSYYCRRPTIPHCSYSHINVPPDWIGFSRPILESCVQSVPQGT